LALGVLNLDSKVSDEVLEKLKRIPQIISMKQVIL
jgi:D-3-phosphoglycerate dehydrogenase